jgi:glutathione synthase/RimK-type ligase-like ATP-grasp enzyme
MMFQSRNGSLVVQRILSAQELRWGARLTSIDFLRDHMPEALRPAASASLRAAGRLLLSDRRFIERNFVRTLGHSPNLAQPRTFSEKVNWRKLHDHNPLFQVAADKLAVRQYVANRIGERYLVPVLGVFDRPEEIPWSELPKPFVVKTTHGSGWNVFVTGCDTSSPRERERELRRWLRMNHFYTQREWGYRHVPRRLIVERFIGPAPQVPEDYKFFCFDGVPQMVQVDYDRFGRHTRTLYDLSWTPLPFTLRHPKGLTVPAPSSLPDMVRVASELSRDLDFVRVDLYAVEDRVYFGELTAYPGAGIEPFTPPEWDEWLGAFWRLPDMAATSAGPSRVMLHHKVRPKPLVESMMGRFDWKQFERRRIVAVSRPRVKALLTPHRESSRVRDDSGKLWVAPQFAVKWPEGVARPRVGLVQDTDSYPYWTKYHRFLEANQFPFHLVNIHGRSWLDELRDVDVLVWRPSSEPSKLEEARRKIFYLSEFTHVQCYPSLRAVTLYENKILQSFAFAALGVETPRTVVSFTLRDALEGVSALGEKVVWKITTGSGSFGVERMRASQVRAATRRAFSVRGRKTYWPYLNQKNYVYAQALESGLRTDMRVIALGPLLFGYFRDAPPNDFRASGMGRERLGAIPVEGLEEAWRMGQSLDVGAVGIDSLIDQDCRTRLATEFSSFISVDTAELLAVDGRPGVYVRRSPYRFEFLEGRYWLQELALTRALGLACGLDGDQLLLDSFEAHQARVASLAADGATAAESTRYAEECSG